VDFVDVIVSISVFVVDMHKIVSNLSSDTDLNDMLLHL